MNNSWIQTHTGKKFFPLDPNLDDIDIEDIAHALSMLCRFNGHCSDFYSVAQHSVLVSQWCEPSHALYGLLHDASEGLGLSDISSPIKRSEVFSQYRKAEHTLQAAIYKKFGLDEVEPESVKVSDLKMLATEATQLMSPLNKEFTFKYEPLNFKINLLNPMEAKTLFLDRFNWIKNGKK